MFGYLCIVICFILARNSRPEYRVIAYLLLAEFVAHKLAYVFGDQLMSIPGSLVYTSYVIIELSAIIYLKIFQSHRAIMTLVFISLVYNALVVSQYSFPVYDYTVNYKLIMGVLMLLELIYLGMLTAYVANFRRKHGFISTVHIDRLFMVRRRDLDRVYIQGLTG